MTRTYVDESGELKVVHAHDKTTLADFIVDPDAPRRGDAEPRAQPAARRSHADEPVAAPRAEQSDLPKWARDLDDEEIARRMQAEENAAAAQESDASAQRKKPIDRDGIRSATRGFAELDLGSTAKSASASASAAASTSTAASASAGASASASAADTHAWSDAEQARLEEALKLFPGSAADKERWAKIAEHVGRSRKECVERFKHCASLVKQKAKQ